MEWKAAKTPTFEYITAQLEFSQQSSLSGILCDMPNIGKTFTARYYVQSHKNTVYIDCSQVKTKLKLVRKIAAEFGVDSKGSILMCMKTWYITSVRWKPRLSSSMKQATCSMKLSWN